MAAANVAWDLSAEDFESWRQVVWAWGGYTERLFDYHDFGFPRQDFQAQVAAVSADLARAASESGVRAARLWPSTPEARARVSAAAHPWNPAKSLGYLAGASFLIQRIRPSVPPETVRTALLAKTCYQCVQDILDDLMDEANLPYPEAQALYELAFSSMVGDVAADDLQAGLLDVAPSAAAPAVGRLAAAVSGLQAMLRRAPARDAVEEFERLNDWVVVSQPMTALLKAPNRDLLQVREVASTLSAPAADLSWQERFGGHLSWPLQHSLLDMAFSEEPLSGRALAAHRDAWFYLHAVLTNLNHLAAVREDLGHGIVNVALLTLREATLLAGEDPNAAADLTVADHEALFDRTAELTRRALERGADGFDDPQHFCAAIAVLVGVVAMASRIGRDDEMIHGYMRWLAPVIRDAVRG